MATGDLKTRAAFKSSKATTAVCNTLLRIMYIMLNLVSDAYGGCTFLHVYIPVIHQR